MKKRLSIFLKLIGIMGLAVVLINASVIIATRLAFDLPEDIPPSPRGYAKVIADYLADEIGSPPDTLKAQKFAEKLGVQIRVISPNYVWSSAAEIDWDEPPPFAPPLLEPPTERKRARPFRPKELRRGIVIMRGDVEFNFRLRDLPPPQSFFSTEKAVFWLLLFLSLIVVGIFFLLRSMFSPIQTLIEGTERISKGDFTTSILVKRRDELGELAESFNAMTTKISAMLKREKELLLDVSHELRSPLTRMNVALELLPESPAKTQIKADVKELNAMLTELLESERLHSQNGSLKISAFEATALANEIKAEFWDEAARINIVSTGFITLEADRERVRLLLRNLVSNALKYSQDEVTLRLSASDNEMAMEVCDKGKGIAQEELEKIFEPFYRTESSRARIKSEGGYGLGLYLCKKIAEAHHGKISAKSDSDGTCFKTTLPRLQTLTAS